MNTFVSLNVHFPYICTIIDVSRRVIFLRINQAQLGDFYALSISLLF
jgi:hypothetical protein